MTHSKGAGGAKNKPQGTTQATVLPRGTAALAQTAREADAAPWAGQNGFDARQTQDGQLALWQMLAERTQRFTMGESSSVDLETAEELLRSICFTLEVHARETGAPALPQTQAPIALLQTARGTLEAKIAQGKRLLHRAKATAPPMHSRLYLDMLQGAAAFFRRYDYRFFAHQSPTCLDYPLSQPVPERFGGVCYLNEYLRRINLENAFCRYFAPATMMAAVRGSCPKDRELSVNLYAPVAANALGCALCACPVRALQITDADRDALGARFRAMGEVPGPGIALLDKAAIEVCRRLQIETEGALCAYLRQTAAELYPRIATAQNLVGVFVPLRGDGA